MVVGWAMQSITGRNEGGLHDYCKRQKQTGTHLEDCALRGRGQGNGGGVHDAVHDIAFLTAPIHPLPRLAAHLRTLPAHRFRQQLCLPDLQNGTLYHVMLASQHGRDRTNLLSQNGVWCHACFWAFKASGKREPWMLGRWDQKQTGTVRREAHGDQCQGGTKQNVGCFRRFLAPAVQHSTKNCMGPEGESCCAKNTSSMHVEHAEAAAQSHSHVCYWTFGSMDMDIQALPAAVRSRITGQPRGCAKVHIYPVKLVQSRHVQRSVKRILPGSDPKVCSLAAPDAEQSHLKQLERYGSHKHREEGMSGGATIIHPVGKILRCLLLRTSHQRYLGGTNNIVDYTSEIAEYHMQQGVHLPASLAA